MNEVAAAAALVPADDSTPVMLPVAATAPAALLQVITRAAADPTLDLERVASLLAMYERLTERQAERAFTEAMAEFKASAPRITKDKLVSFTIQGGGTTSYRHASIGAVCDAIIPGLAAVGISHRWDLERKEGRVSVTCVLTHKDGHSTRTTWDGAPDDSGKKNAIQQGASTITYLQRYTLLAATGIGVSEQDDDGRGSEGREPPPDGYDNWQADMDAVADWPDLERAWGKSNGLYRAYATLHDADWWEARKASAKRASAGQ